MVLASPLSRIVDVMLKLAIFCRYFWGEYTFALLPLPRLGATSKSAAPVISNMSASPVSVAYRLSRNYSLARDGLLENFHLS